MLFEMDEQSKGFKPVSGMNIVDSLGEHEKDLEPAENHGDDEHELGKPVKLRIGQPGHGRRGRVRPACREWPGPDRAMCR